MDIKPPRRTFIRQMAASGALLGVAGFSGCTASGVAEDAAPGFRHGVASGDPLSDRVILWTRVTSARDGEVAVRWQVATDAAMRQVIAHGSVTTSAQRDYTVKVDAGGLLPGHVYYYQFAVEGGDKSVVGRTKTLARNGAKQVRLAVFSCSNYPAGYFNVYADAARQDNIDAALHIGDYIYEYESTGYACGNAEALGRVSEPRDVLLRLDEYRRRYAQYRSDPDLQAVHAAMPFITVWDDHEIADDTWRDGSVDHKASKYGPFELRKQAALTAYHEWMPIRVPDMAAPDKIYRSFDFGGIVSLHMLDTRLIGRDQQLMMSSYYDAHKCFDVEKYRQDVCSPRRQMIGHEQMAWLEAQVSRSAARWQILGQQVLMARMEYPTAVVMGECNTTDYCALKQRAKADPACVNEKEQRWLSGPTLPCYLDSWDGYQADREQVFEMMNKHRKNLVVLAGDTHNAWASDLRDVRGRQVGVEFATASVSSPGMEGGYPDRDPDDVAAMMVDLIEPLYYAQTSKRGYMIVTASHEQVRCDWRFVDTVFKHEFTAATERSLRVLPGPGNRRIEECYEV
ncbi:MULTISPECIES: alkaline phosphatase [unclassified Duganella]|uniref:alkaline phosphatase D family protein n=1 Tax=unclassified Duganella TaxID=2636909 RepID=UPI00088BCB3F|nr:MULTISPECIES: alkaline phosphatase D family protein [unclassified Duganella]SDH65138.1 alkaline phosphatase D [Duganella sp. OV458]SDK74840.1 alkaline phosphatase D [Duganella sp. OV510]